MIKPCARCKNPHGEDELRDIRGDDEIEGHLIANYPEVLTIPPENPLEICLNCLRELNDPERNNNSQIVRNKSMNNATKDANISSSEDIPIQSESIGSNIEVPLSSSVTKKVAISDSFDLNRLKDPGEIEKLVPNNRAVQKNVRQLLGKSMPNAVKRRRLNDMLNENANTTVLNRQENISDVQSETVKEQTHQDLVQAAFERLANRPARINRTYKSNSSISSQSSNHSQSFSSNHIYDASSQNPVIRSEEVVPIPASPIISTRTQSNLVNLYQPDSSTDSDRRNDNEPRRSSERLARNSRNTSVSSNDSQADRQTARTANDGNNHSNLAAPRRINTVVPTSTRPHGINLKLTNGG